MYQEQAEHACRGLAVSTIARPRLGAKPSPTRQRRDQMEYRICAE